MRHWRLVIWVLVLLAVGPNDRLPTMIKTIARTYRQLRRTAQDIRSSTGIDEMLREYPDARVVQMHHDPVKVAMSIGSLTATLRSLGSDRVDLPEVTRQYVGLLEYGTRKTMAARASGKLGPDRVIDVQFAEFRRDPLATVSRVYAHLGFTLADDTALRMQRFLADGAASSRHERHRYDLGDSGIDLAAERARFAGYQQAYAIPSEIA